MIEDPLFYILAVPAILIVGISKAGFGGGLGVVGVPLMALAVSPVLAAAVMLPILCVMDLMTVSVYRNKWDWGNLKVLLPGAVVGIALGTLSFGTLDEGMIKLLIGVVAILFTLNWVKAQIGKKRSAEGSAPAGTPNSTTGGLFWGGVGGFTSFLAHAGGPPLSMHLIPQRLDKTVFQATTVIFFIVVNYVKLVPYAFLGLLETSVLTTSLVLMPLAVLGIVLGVWMHKRVSDTWFYRLCYAFLFITGAKLTYDGLVQTVFAV